jgi:hypothetical protein
MKELLDYAQKVGKVGTLMNGTAQKYGEVTAKYEDSNKTLDDTKVLKNEYLDLLQEFKSQEEEIKAVKSPAILKEQHVNLENAFHQYVMATEIGIDSLDVTNGTVDQKKFNEGTTKQTIASKEIVQISNKLVEIINKTVSK